MVLLGVAAASVAAFVLSSVYYALLPATGASEEPTDGRPAPWQVVVELVRSAMVAALVAGLMTAGGWDGALDGGLLGLALWTLPVVLLAGSVVWEHVPWRRAAGHVGDWLVKLVVVGSIVGAFG